MVCEQSMCNKQVILPLSANTVEQLCAGSTFQQRKLEKTGAVLRYRLKCDAD